MKILAVLAVLVLLVFLAIVGLFCPACIGAGIEEKKGV